MVDLRQEMREHDQLLRKRQAMYERATEEKRDLTASEKADDRALEKQCDEMAVKIDALKKIERQRMGIPENQPEIGPQARGGGGGMETASLNHGYRSATGPFGTFGEQLQCIARAEMPGQQADNRLYEIRQSGMSESVPSEGGFLVQTDFADRLLKQMFTAGLLASRCEQFPISGRANGVVINTVDETSRAEGQRWGGIKIYNLGEADEKKASLIKFKQLELKLHKKVGLCFVTDELLQDAGLLEQFLTRAYSDEMSFKVDDEILSGSGVGQLLGILNSPALVAVPKEVGQPADTILYENLVNMFARFSGDLRRAVFIANRDVIPQLYSLSLAVGVGGIPVYLPANGLAGSPYSTLFGVPLLLLEQSPTLGDQGDIALVDLSWYCLARKSGMEGGIQVASSIHVKFIYDETAFRFVLRIDGQPFISSPLTPYRGVNTISPFVVLEERA